jgi:4-hydroxy-tetrahydrodipicolinate synthase
MIKGSLVAIVTPMHEDGSIDYASYRKLIDWHVASGTAAIVAVGTTGESPTVSVSEHCELIRVAVEQCAGRIPVIAGTGGNATAEAIELTEFAKKAGATSSLQVVPYYNRPTQEGMYRHFRAVVEAVDLPIIVYNVPGRTVADLSNDTVLRLAELPQVIGIKDATGDIPRGSELIGRLPSRFAVYSGNDDSALALMAMGGHGVISVVANLAPEAMAKMCAAALAGDWTSARAINQKLLPLHMKLFVEANPIPLKWAMHHLGMAPAGIRLPMTPLSSSHHETVLSAMRAGGLLT